MKRLLGRIRSPDGLSLTELVLYLGVVGLIGFWVANFLSIPARINKSHQKSQVERDLGKAMDAMVSDLRECSGGTILSPSDGKKFADWVQANPLNIPPIPGDAYPSIQFGIWNYDDPDSPQINQITYSASPQTLSRAAATGSLALYTARDSSAKLQLSFQKDPNNSNVIDIALTYIVGVDSFTLGRQAAVRN